MLYNLLYDIFRKSPNFSRKILHSIPLKYRLGGKSFSDTYRFLHESEHWSYERIHRYQSKCLHKILKHVQKNVPFYSNIKSLSSNPYKDLGRFPIVDKTQIQTKFNHFIVKNLKYYKYYHVTTGGTSGNTLNIYLDNSTYGKEWAFVLTGWRRAKFKLGDRTVSFRGVEFHNAEKGIFWQDNPIYNMLEMSPFHMSESNIPKYIDKIIQFKPRFLHGYPSAISILANYIIRKEISFPSLSGILAISENIYPKQRELIENAFNTRLFSFYGMSEKVINAPECEFDTRYHCFPEYGISEVLDKNGCPVGEGEKGELVGTGFLNHCMPFIRYRTGDFAILCDSACKCGRNHILLTNLTGRWMQDMIVARNGSLISMTALNLHSNVFRNVHQYQYQQFKEGEVILLIVPGEMYNSTDEHTIRSALFSKIGYDIDLNIKYVNYISLTQRGKEKVLIQKLNIDSYYEDLV